MKIDGLRVVDAKRSVKITITPRDITRGKVKEPSTCAAAVACVRQIPSCVEARVHLGRTYLKGSDRWVRFQTPRSIRSEMIAFDRGAPFEPGEYLLSPTSEAKQTGKRQGGRDKPRPTGGAGKKRAPYHRVKGVRPHAPTAWS